MAAVMRGWIGLLLLCVGGSLGADRPLRHAQDRPNILFIMSDDHTSQAWGVYGGLLDPVIDNPNIDRLAREGALLPNVFCANSICTPSRATILTGQYSHHNGVKVLADAMDPTATTVATRLQAAGYETALFGKWHLKTKPAGFDTFRVLPGQGRYHDPLLKGPENWQDGYRGGSPVPGFSADVITDLSLAWLEAREGGAPFFLMCQFKATHEPFDYPARHADLYADVTMPEPASLYQFEPADSGRTFVGQQLEILGARFLGDQPYSQTYPGTFSMPEGASPREFRHRTYQKFVKDFLRCGRAIDDNIGRLLDYLDETGLAEDTIVIYTSDQGYFLGEHGFFDKRMMYEEALRMPFVVRYPREIEGGTAPDAMISNIDFAPLMLDYAGLSTPAEMDGRSFRSVLHGEQPTDWRDTIYYRYWQHLAVRPAHYGIRTPTDKLIRFYGDGFGLIGTDETKTKPAWEYYDLVEDPAESRNAYGDPAYADRVAALQIRLEKLVFDAGDSTP
jgi:arylsulfatase A-like enzyme